MKVICLELWHHVLGPFPAGRGQRSQSGTTKTQIGGLGCCKWACCGLQARHQSHPISCLGTTKHNTPPRMPRGRNCYEEKALDMKKKKNPFSGKGTNPFLLKDSASRWRPASGILTTVSLRHHPHAGLLQLQFHRASFTERTLEKYTDWREGGKQEFGDIFQRKIL